MATRAYDKRHVPWPIRVLGLLFSFTLVVLILMGTGLAAAAIGATAYYELTRTTAGDVEAKIDQKAPKGSSVEHIYAVLDAEGIEHGTVQPFAGDDMKVLYAGVKAGTPIITATVPNDGYSLEMVDVHVAFVLDESGTLANTVVYERDYQPEWLQEKLDSLK